MEKDTLLHCLIGSISFTYWFLTLNRLGAQFCFNYVMCWLADCMCPSAPFQQPPQALEYLFKFIVQSRILYSRATCGMEEEQFRASIQELFQSIRFVLSLDSRSSENLVFTQVRQFKHHNNLFKCPPLRKYGVIYNYSFIKYSQLNYCFFSPLNCLWCHCCYRFTLYILLLMLQFLKITASLAWSWKL